MRAKVMKYGKGLAVRVPASLARQARLEAGMVVGITLVDGNFVITLVMHQEPNLEQLLNTTP